MNGWYTSDVTVAFTAADQDSEVTDTEYRLNGGEWTNYTGAVSVSAEGITTMEYRSRDGAGNVEETRSLVIPIDKTEPELTVNPNLDALWPPNRKWVPIEMTLDTKDESSGILLIALVSVTTEGTPDPLEGIRDADIGTADTSFQLLAANHRRGAKRAYIITYEARDKAGHSTTKTITVEVTRTVKEDER